MQSNHPSGRQVMWPPATRRSHRAALELMFAAEAALAAAADPASEAALDGLTQRLSRLAARSRFVQRPHGRAR